MTFIEDFRSAMGDNGIQYSGEIIVNGELHRFYVEGDSVGTKNGWYVLYDNGIPAGAYGTWKTGESYSWRGGSNDKVISLEERRKHHQETINRKIEIEKCRIEKQKKAALSATLLWEDASECVSHPYLLKKKCKPYGLRVRNDGTLLVPCKNLAGELVNIERIYLDMSGEFQKRPLSGGVRTGAFYLIGSITEGTPIYIGEGYSTMSTVHEATCAPCVVSFYCGNLLQVSRGIRYLYPKNEIIFSADSDDNQIGERCANAAAMCVDSGVRLPDFSEIPSKLSPHIKRSDFNDLFYLLMEKGYSRNDALCKVRRQLSI